VQLVDYPPGSRFGPRTLEDYEFLWILAGSAVWTLHHREPAATLRASAPVTLRPGMLLLAPAGAVDSFTWDPERSTRHAWAHFRVQDDGPLPAPDTWPLVRSMSAAPVLDGLCSYLIGLGSQPSPASRQRSDQLLSLLLDLFVRGPLEEHVPTEPTAVIAAARAASAIWAAEGVRLVEVHELAAAAHVSPGHLYRVFRQRYGCGPARALELIRLSRAAVMVQRSNASLAEVAAGSGFANAYHLSRRFREAYGTPPSTYRRSQPSTDPMAPVLSAGLQPFARLLAGG
jgi:AraC family transcriptional regulator